MVSRKTSQFIRKAHRYLGIFLGIQFIGWTVSGLYFSWTDIDEIHGDHFRKIPPTQIRFSDLVPPTIPGSYKIYKMELREIAGQAFYWINDSLLLNARTGSIRKGITRDEALVVAGNYIRSDMKVRDVQRITAVDSHHEYRDKPLPAYVISYEGPELLKAYVSERDGKFQTVRYQSWRWFDFLWMTHTMDYQGRDDFNTLLLRIFSLMGLITVLSGFMLWMISSPRLRKVFQMLKDKKHE
jgi:hypothetical protein